MRRTKSNRWWTFALATFVLASCVVTLPAVALADWSSNGGIIGDGNPGGAQTPSVPPPSGAGDPDSPSTSGRSGKPSFGVARPGTGIYGAQGATSTAAVNRGLWLMKVRIAMESFRIFTLRY